MQVIKNKSGLENAIRQLESRRVSQADSLREHWEVTREELNPVNIFKDEMHDTLASPGFGSTVAKGIFSLVTGIITKKLVVGSSESSFKKVLGTLAQTGATGMIYKNSEQMTTSGASALSSFLKKLKI
jgi:hypothetical protein